MNIEVLLASLGLKEKKAAVYLALLELGTAMVPSLAQKAGVQRTTTYDILEDLQLEGLVIYRELGGKRHYRCTDPRRFKSQLDRRQRELEEGLPLLTNLYKPSKEYPVIRVFEGTEEVAYIYEELLKAKTIDAYGSYENITQHYPPFPELLKQHGRKGGRIRDIGVRSPIAESYAMFYRPPRQELRLLPATTVLDSDTIIFDNSVALISYGDTVHGVIIESSSLAKAQRLAFEALWGMAERP